MLLLAVIVAGAAYFLSRQQTPIYNASQKVVIQPSRPDLGLTESSKRILEPLVVIMNSETIAAEIIEENRLDMTPGQLKSNATIAADEFRLVIQFDVKSSEPDVASLVARAWGLKLKDYRDAQNQLVRREDRVNAVLPDNPSVAQDSPRPKIMAVAGLILGLLVGGVIVFVLELLEGNIVQRREDLERDDLPVLAAIPQEN